MFALFSIALLLSSTVAGETIRLKARQQVTVEKKVDPRPVLGKASYFTVLTKTGVAVVPTVEVYGNLGIAPVAMSYFTGLSYELTPDFDHAQAAQVSNGFLYGGDSTNSPPASAGQAVDDMMTCYDNMMGLSGSVEPEKGGGILDGLNLAAGLYTWSTAVALHAGQNLTLTGDANSVYVLQAAGDFTFGAGSQIIRGDVNPYNIFFVTATSFTTAAETKIFGNIFTGTNVVLGDNCELTGGVYAQTELAIAKGVKIKSSSPCCTKQKPGQDNCSKFATPLASC